MRGDATPAHALPAVPPAPAAVAALDDGFVADFAAELIAGDAARVQARVAALREAGMSAEAVCLHALTPAARRLGDLWAADRCSFIEVTTGTALLHGLMNALRPDFKARPVAGMRARRAMLVTAPGEQHRFGLSMLAEFFRKDGWQVSLPNATTTAQVIALAAARPLDMVGFSAGGEGHLGALAACIAAVRAAAGPDLLIMVGGPVFLARPELVRMVGADGTGADAEAAVQRAASLLKSRRAAAIVPMPVRRRLPATVV